MITNTLTVSDMYKLIDFIQKHATWEEMTELHPNFVGYDEFDMVRAGIYPIYLKLCEASGRTPQQLTENKKVE